MSNFQFIPSPLRREGFSLVELAIVLVILGLLVGGILAGKSLIQAAELRSQIAQIERYRTAAHTFRNKYNYLPGDLPDAFATALGFTGVSSNGDGMINGWNCCAVSGYAQSGEPVAFWQQLSAPNVGLVEGNFTANPNSIPATQAAVPLYYPRAVIPNNFVYVWNCDLGICTTGFNVITISNIGSVLSNWSMQQGNPIGMTVQQAWSIDTKLDDGMPMQGAITTMKLHGAATWSAYTSGNPNPISTCSAPAPPGYSGGPQTYELKYNANNPNCALTFRL